VLASTLPWDGIAVIPDESVFGFDVDSLASLLKFQNLPLTLRLHALIFCLYTSWPCTLYYTL